MLRKYFKTNAPQVRDHAQLSVFPPIKCTHFIEAPCSQWISREQGRSTSGIVNLYK